MHIQGVDQVDKGVVEARPLRLLLVQRGVERQHQQPVRETVTGSEAQAMQPSHGLKPTPSRAARHRREDWHTLAHQEAHTTGTPVFRVA